MLPLGRICKEMVLFYPLMAVSIFALICWGVQGENWSVFVCFVDLMCQQPDCFQLSAAIWAKERLMAGYEEKQCHNFTGIHGTSLRKKVKMEETYMGL